MITHVSGSRARRSALLGAAAVLAGGTFLAAPAHAAPAHGHSGTKGTAGATAARADLQVSVADAAKVPVRASLNEVSAPRSADRTLLTAEVNGANKGRPLKLVQAEVARSAAKTGADRSSGHVKLAGVRAFAPGLLGKPLVSADLLTATATCEAGAKPTAQADLENVSVLGKPVNVNAPGGQQIKLPGVGTVDVSLEQETTKTASGAATALKLSYEVNPAKLNIVKATGDIVLSEATCETPKGGSDGNEPGPQTGGGDGGDAGSNNGDGGGLAETGGDATTPIIAATGALLVAGGTTMYLVRRRAARNS
ncbi:LPXTG-motif cell wall-anchored protein [Streptomyces sp. Amel2xB2]|uniref:SCO1860 family LAETG-anchored protein n=1 Tax=Streptomyces sp. Amel2xB2 TaxID=1305829 RepID=UPI000DB9E0D2|nr:SCO1860 family LAETG-anchored protein [Streptomyces sp. Amel2xB2]RAJ61627.1 LPXTG-motif cell wall-anchored protein [Streptomyces sp. Amel2xB2]